MRILVIGDAGSIFIKQYIEYVLLGCQNEVVLLREGIVCPDFEVFYYNAGIKIEPFSIKTTKLVSRIPKIRSSLGCYLWSRYIVRKYSHFDLIHIHGLNINRGNIGLYTSKITSKLAITVWGDELFRKSDKVLKKYMKYYNLADYITVSTNVMYGRFNEVYRNSYQTRMSINKFAVGILDLISEVKHQSSRTEICKSFGINDSEKILVFIGHNGREAQRHFEISHQITKLSEISKQKIILVYTMTYGVKNPTYLSRLKNKAIETGCESVFLTEFLNEQRMAELRTICDIMIHAQLTDAFSASLCECLYAGSIIINGSWLNYSDIPNCHTKFIEYDYIDQISGKLDMVLNDYSHYKERTVDNKKDIYDLCSIKTTTTAWKKALNLP